LLYDEAIKEYAAKKFRKRKIIELYQAVNYWKYYYFLFFYFFMFVIFISLFKFVIF
jgi:hypothetical protein